MLTFIVSLIIIGLIIADIFFVELENFGWTTLSIIVTGGLLYWTKLWGVSDWVVNNAKWCVIFTAIYIVSGVVWSFIKWFSYLIKHRDKFLDIKNEYVKLNGQLIESQYDWAQNTHQTFKNNPVTKEILPFDRYCHSDLLEKYSQESETNRSLYNRYSSKKEDYRSFYKPKASDNKSKIVAWICYWPFSLIGTFINDPIRRLINFIFKSLRAAYQKMSDKIFADFPDNNHY